MPWQPKPKPQKKSNQLILKIIALFLLSVSAILFYKLFSEKESSKTSETYQSYREPLEESKWNELVYKLKEMAERYPANVGIYLKDLTQGKEWTYRPDRLFPSASLIKVPIMAATLLKCERSKIDLNTELTLTAKERRAGSGSLKWAREGTRLSILEVIYKMITESDNTAAQMLLDYFGIYYFQEAFKELGLAYTNITQEGMSLTSGRVAKENYTTPREMAYLLEKIYRGELVSKQSSELMLDILKRTKSRSRLKKGIPIGWEIGHKTGLLRKSCHDAGIVFSPRGDYIIVVMTSKVPDYRSAKEFITKIGKITASYYNYHLLSGNYGDKDRDKREV